MNIRYPIYEGVYRILTLEQNKLSDGRISLYLEYYFLLKLLKVILSKRNTFYSYSFRQYLYLAVNRKKFSTVWIYRQKTD